MLRFCCNQRDVHFLRALSLRVLGDAINAHDDGILQAVAGVMAQVVPLDTDSDALESAVAGAPLGPVRLTASFLANRERASLPFSMGGLAIRRWSPHAHAAYVAHSGKGKIRKAGLNSEKLPVGDQGKGSRRNGIPGKMQ